MDEQAILSLGTVVLLGCGAELMRLQRRNASLRGLATTGKAILTGGMAAACLLGATWLGWLQPIGTLLILVAFGIFHGALKELTKDPAHSFFLTCGLLCLQTLGAAGQIFHLLSAQAGLVLFSFLLAGELMLILKLLWKNTGFEAGGTATIVWLLRAVLVLMVLRGTAAATGMLRSASVAYWSDTLTYGLLIAIGLGLGFGYFAMITSDLASELQRQAETDPLTLALNRRSFLDRCKVELDRSRRSGLPITLLLLDLDHFKQFNDTYGHQAGDQALRVAVDGIRGATRSIDLICRWGGEEFAVILPGATREASWITAERIRNSVRKAGESGRWQSQVLTTSVGAATYQGNAPEFESLLQRADEALYEAKRRGRDQTVLAEPERQESSFMDEGSAGATGP